MEGAQVGGWSRQRWVHSDSDLSDAQGPWTSGMKSLPVPTRTAKGMPLPADLAAQQPQLWEVSAKPTQGLSSSSAWSKLPIQVCGWRVGEKVCNMEMRVPLRPLQSAAVQVPVTAQQPPVAPMPGPLLCTQLHQPVRRTHLRLT